MPIVRVQTPEGYSNEVKDRIADGLRDAINDSIDPGRNDRFISSHIHISRRNRRWR